MTDGNNLKFWDIVSKTNPNNTKQVDFGRKFTSIDAYSQIKVATKEWGMFGTGWGVRDESFKVIGEDVFSLMIYNGILYYPGCSETGIPLASSENFITEKNSKKRIDGDVVKKLATDALTKGLSRLGFNADVFMGLYDDDKYVNKIKQEFNKPADKRIERLTAYILAEANNDKDCAKDLFQTTMKECNLPVTLNRTTMTTEHLDIIFGKIGKEVEAFEKSQT